ncbi:MAG: restriction endonuclease subunit S [Methanobacteriaceae archaeon]|nr:restriction endonuclease subunit S [Methanobacteriaceae archaeon]
MSDKIIFKETEIGLIPEEWDNVEFGSVLLGGTRNGVYKSKEFHGAGVKIINMGELFANPRLFSIPMRRLKLTDEEFNRSSVEKGDLLFARRSLVAEGAGKCILVCEIDEPTTFESSIIRARPNSKIVDSRYLYYFFNSSYGEYLLNTIRRQVAVAGITGSDLVKLSIPIPSLEEQKRIADVLEKFDQKILINQKMIQTLEETGQAVFKQWFAHFEFPNEEGKPYKSSGGEMVDSELGEIPKDWEIKSLDKIANYLNGLALQKFPPEKEDYLPVIKIRELKQGVTAASDKASSKIDPNYIIDNGNVIFSWSGSLEVVLWCGGKGALNQHLFKVSSEEYPKWFYYYWTKYHLETFRQTAADKTTTMGHIKRKDLSDALVITPSNELFSKFNKIMAPLIDLIINNNIESRNLSKTRDSLLPKLMSGKIRVSLEEK